MATVEGREGRSGFELGGVVGPGPEEVGGADAVADAVVDGCTENHATTSEIAYLSAIRKAIH